MRGTGYPELPWQVFATARMTTDPDPSRSALRQLLDAFDGRAVGRLELVAGRPRTGLLFEAFETHQLEDLDVALVLAALAAQAHGEPALTGQELAAAVADDSATRLQALGCLTSASPALRSGMLLPEVVPAHGPEAHATSFRLGEQVFRLACEVFGRPPRPQPAPETGPFRANAEILGELRRLSLDYRRRAVRIFQLDPWSGTGIEVLDGTAALVERGRREAARIEARLRCTPVERPFPVLSLRRRHRLDLDALVVLATVLFQELLEGVGAVDAVDLLKLVCESEAELLERRHWLAPLAAAGLLRLDGGFAGKDLTADVSLPNEVVDGLLGAQGSLGADDRLDFHAYIQQLDSSEPFFRDMDGSSFGS